MTMPWSRPRGSVHTGGGVHRPQNVPETPEIDSRQNLTFCILGKKRLWVSHLVSFKKFSRPIMSLMCHGIVTAEKISRACTRRF